MNNRVMPKYNIPAPTPEKQRETIDAWSKVRKGRFEPLTMTEILADIRRRSQARKRPAIKLPPNVPWPTYTGERRNANLYPYKTPRVQYSPSVRVKPPAAQPQFGRPITNRGSIGREFERNRTTNRPASDVTNRIAKALSNKLDNILANY